MASAFINASKLEKLPLIDTSRVKNWYQAFRGCTSLKSVPAFDFSSATSLNETFYLCSALVDFPLVSIPRVTIMNNIFSSCINLSNDSLNNIMAMCINASAYGQAKTLRQIGLASSQATTCQSLSNYQAFLAAGWTTGY